MTRWSPIALAAFLFVGPSAVWASAALVLNDGQVIRGSEVRRDGDQFLVTMAGGNTVPFPAALVREIKFEEDVPPPPPGFDVSGPKQLAGPPVPPPNTADALKVMGPPTRWSKDAVDTSWQPTNAWDPNVDVLAGSRSTWSKSAVDTTWKPVNAYDPHADVMANSKSSWSKSVVDTTWQPTDGFGFKKLSFKGAAATPPELLASVPAPAPYAERSTPASSAPSPWECAEKIFTAHASDPMKNDTQKSKKLEVHPIKTPLYASLGLPLYEARGTADGATRRAVFTITSDTCRLVGGDVDSILGLNLTADHAMAQDGASFNAAMATRGGARAPTGIDKLDYAYALVSLTDPRVSGEQGATLRLVSKPEEIGSIAKGIGAPTNCTQSKGKRRKAERDAAAAFKSPKIETGPEGEVVTFMTWSSAGGTFYKNTVVLANGGIVTAHRDVVATHVGDHKDDPGTP